VQSDETLHDRLGAESLLLELVERELFQTIAESWTGR